MNLRVIYYDAISCALPNNAQQDTARNKVLPGFELTHATKISMKGPDLTSSCAKEIHSIITQKPQQILCFTEF